LLEAAIHALGLWVQSGQPTDIGAADGTATQLSPRDVATLRCLYSAPPYGDGIIDD
jgi:predicted Zn-dependent protease